MAKALTRCPVCESALAIAELLCGRCGTRISGAFDACRFCRLPPEHLAFVELFLKCEGNLSRVEKELNLSYPTVRNRLSAAVAALGFGEPAEPPAPAPVSSAGSARRRELLEALSRGELTADEAAAELRNLA